MMQKEYMAQECIDCMGGGGARTRTVTFLRQKMQNWNLNPVLLRKNYFNS